MAHRLWIFYAMLVASCLFALEYALRRHERMLKLATAAKKAVIDDEVNPRVLRLDGYVLIPFTKVCVMGCEEGVVTAVPPVGVKLCYLVVPRESAADLELVSLRVGANEQFASEGAVSADVFSGNLHLWGFPGEGDRVKSVALDFPVPLDIEDPVGRTVEIRVRNQSPRAHNFTAVMFGKRISDRKL